MLTIKLRDLRMRNKWLITKWHPWLPLFIFLWQTVFNWYFYWGIIVYNHTEITVLCLLHCYYQSFCQCSKPSLLSERLCSHSTQLNFFRSKFCLSSHGFVCIAHYLIPFFVSLCFTYNWDHQSESFTF